MAAIANDWLVPMSGEFKKPYYRKLYETVKSEYETKEVYPAPDDIFKLPLRLLLLSKVKVVNPGTGPVPRGGAGAWTELFRKAVGGDPAVPCQYL